MEATCMQLSIEGERLLKAHDYEGAIEFFEAGLRAGTDDYEVLSAVFNQLGNACFYVGKFHKALEYHKKDLEIAEKLNDRQGMAKAFGNLGNTFKSLKNYSNAIRCCEAHLEITRELGDRLGEGRACYNLGNVYHALGKAKMAKPADYNEGKADVETAIKYYKTSLDITTELKDAAGEGRAVGNLGNAYTAIGEFGEAVKYHLRRLKIANDSNDLPAKARACGNLGNAYSALNEFSDAIKYYQQSLNVAKESGNIPGQGQAYFCLGTTYASLKNYVRAVEFHEHHLEIATQVGDKQGMQRAWQNLRNAHHMLGDTAKTVYYHKLVQQAQAQNKGGAETAANNAPTPQEETIPAPSQDQREQSFGEKSIPQNKKDQAGLSDKMKQLFKKSATDKNAVQAFSVEDSDDDDDIVRVRKAGNAAAGTVATAEPEKKSNLATDWLNDSIKPKPEAAAGGSSAGGSSHTGSVSKATANNVEEDSNSTLPNMDFFEMLLASQHSRLDDQRSPAPSAMSSHAAAAANNNNISSGNSAANGSEGASSTLPETPKAAPKEIVVTEKDESFFDMLVSMQSTRLDEQRSPAPKGTKAASVQAAPAPAVELDDSMSFFEMLAAANRK
eukprot:m.131433 g.131433  ORF g.131433 m.131433 type:complete len:614 (-) comp16462_c0_seq3:470-2311(-)